MTQDIQQRQLGFWRDEQEPEYPGYLTEQLITYIGNKRSLLDPIGFAVEKVKRRLDKKHLRILDAFSGSGVVSRFFKQHSSLLFSNDFEEYAGVIGRCFLSNHSEIDFSALSKWVDTLNTSVDSCGLPKGFIEELYAPRDDQNITRRDRAFYTCSNARRLDNYRRLIEEIPSIYRELLLGPLLSEASVHANTSGVFKGFYKDRRTGVGRFGGTNGDALTRITGEITLRLPVLSRFECDYEVYSEDANQIVRFLDDLDLAYFDPPYNQHPYGSNYFMLNLVTNYKRPEQVSPVSGIPIDWQRSRYNIRAASLACFRDLVSNVNAKFVLVSYNDEGYITPEDMVGLLREHGSVEVVDIKYNTFRGSRNLRKRSTHVVEHLFLLERD